MSPRLIQNGRTASLRTTDDLPIRLRDGRAVHIVSALLLQLIQSCTHGVQAEIDRRRTKARSQMILDKKEDGDDAIASADLEKQEAHVYSAGLKASTESAKSIAVFLVQS